MIVGQLLRRRRHELADRPGFVGTVAPQAKLLFQVVTALAGDGGKPRVLVLRQTVHPVAAGAGGNVAIGYAAHGDPFTESKQFAAVFKRFAGNRHVPLFREEGRQIADLLFAQFDGDRLA